MFDTKACEKWDRRFLDVAKVIASWSKDPSKKVGCVVVNQERHIVATGFNGFPRDIADDERLDTKEEKYPIIVHAEENCVAQAARIGVSLRGCIAYTTFTPCSRCARFLIQSGIEECVWPAEEIPDRWKEDMKRSKALLKEAGVRMRAINMEK